ncbi:MAG TPA: MFS transporter [Anaerolineaceae bacterium]|nr:MFS transporter [Anaerolineaceae bacterium]
MDLEVRRNLKYNFTFNVLDGGFFGFGSGFSSFSTVLPLFVSTLTDSAILIGLIPSIHNMGWQLPQLFIAQKIARLPHYKALTLALAVLERLPFLGLAVLAWFVPGISREIALLLTYILLVLQGLGSGVTANPWQILICRIIPGEYRGTFFGAQSAASNLLASGGAVIAGFVLDRLTGSNGFAVCFFTASVLMSLSWLMLSRTREPDRAVDHLPPLDPTPFRDIVLNILRRDRNFRWFLATRMMSPFAMMAMAFFTVYAVRHLGMNELTAGLITSILFVTQVAANPILGRIADRWSRKYMLVLGALCSGASGLLAALAPDLAWFYIVVFLAGIGNTAFWTIGMTFTLDYGSEDEKSTYIGLANTLIAPFTILAPFIGGVLADAIGYTVTFMVSAVFGLITALTLLIFVRDPSKAC